MAALGLIRGWLHQAERSIAGSVGHDEVCTRGTGTTSVGFAGSVREGGRTRAANVRIGFRKPQENGGDIPPQRAENPVKALRGVRAATNRRMPRHPPASSRSSIDARIEPSDDRQWARYVGD